MPERYPLRAGSVAPVEMGVGDTIAASLIPSNLEINTGFTIVLAGMSVGQPIQKSGGVFAIATNSSLDAEIIGVVTAVGSGDEVTISWGIVRGWTHGLSLLAERYWLGNGTFEVSEPSTPANGRKVILGVPCNATTFLFFPRQIQQAA